MNHDGDTEKKRPKRAPLELIITVGRVVVIVASYLLGLRRRRRWGDRL